MGTTRTGLAWLRHLAVIGAVYALGGCGLVQQAGNAALTPVANAAYAIGNDIQVVTGSVSAGASMIGQSVSSASASASAVSATVSQSAAAVAPVASAAPAFSSQQVAALTQLQQMSDTQARQPSKASDPELDILPAATLKQLTKDQNGLQKVVQSIAFSAQVGEPASWYAQGRSGSAVAESEDYMGFFLCRNFVQTVTLNGKTQTAQALACRNPEGGWSLPF